MAPDPYMGRGDVLPRQPQPSAMHRDFAPLIW